MTLKRVLAFAGTGLLVLYASALGFLAFRETALVYPGAGLARARRVAPDTTAGLPWDTLRVTSADSVPVLLLRSRVDDSTHRPWALFLHGNYGTIGARSNVARYQLLRDAGFNVLAVEYRGFGASAATGTPSERGIKADAAAGWTYLTSTLGIPPARVAIYGWSLGGGPATYLAARFRPAALITEGTFTSLPAMATLSYPWIPARYVMRNRFDNGARAREVTMPWLIFHGRSDNTVPFAHGELLAAVSPHARLEALAADHDDGVLAERSRVASTLRELATALSLANASPQPLR